MAQGLLIWDQYGRLALDVTDRLTRVLGIFTATAPGSMSVPEFAIGAGWCVSMPVSGGYGTREIKADVSGTTLSWSVESANPGTISPSMIIYGVY